MTDFDVTLENQPYELNVTTNLVKESFSVTVELSNGLKGDPGNTNVFIQPTQPSFIGAGLWVQTEIGEDNGVTFWIEDGK